MRNSHVVGSAIVNRDDGRRMGSNVNKDISFLEAGTLLGTEAPVGTNSLDRVETEMVTAVSGEDMLRANVYGLLARLLTSPPSDETLEIVRGLADADDGTEMGTALANLGSLAARTPRAQAEDEFTRLFFGFGAGGEITPTASFYQTGFINDKPLANLRQDLLEMGIAVSGLNKEPEDHIAFLCEVMHGLITGGLGSRNQKGIGLDRQKSFFQRHLAAWAARLFGDLEGADAAVLYMPVGTVGKLFMAVEAEAFEMAA